MKHTRLVSALAVTTAMLAVAACGGGSGGSYGDGGTGMTPPPSPPPPPPPAGTNFTVFTRDLLVSATTSDTVEPVELETIEWVFTDDDNATAYDDILTASGP